MKKKTLQWWGNRGYLFRPTISFVLSTHNLSGAAMRVIDDIRQFKDAEIIVIDDGSSHVHTKKLIDDLSGVNEFVIHANDLFDVIVLNRAFDFARGKYIVTIQDDDDYSNRLWIDRAVKILSGRPKLAILGGRDRVTVLPGTKPKKEPRDGIFQYAQVINASPMWVKKDVFLELGGFDNDFAPMLWHEGALCLKAWLSGYHVGWYDSMVKTCTVMTSGRRNIRSQLATASTKKNRLLLMEKFGGRLSEIHEIVKKTGA